MLSLVRSKAQLNSSSFKSEIRLHPIDKHNLKIEFSHQTLTSTCYSASKLFSHRVAMKKHTVAYPFLSYLVNGARGFMRSSTLNIKNCNLKQKMHFQQKFFEKNIHLNIFEAKLKAVNGNQE